MKLQNFEHTRAELVAAFQRKLAETPAWKGQRIKLSWSNWGFGIEGLEDTAQRLERNGVEWIELHGNRYGNDLGYRAQDVLSTLGRHGIRVAGVCGMFGPECDLSSNSGIVRQNAIDYIRRNLDLCQAVGGSYMLVVPGAVGRPRAYDDCEFDRSVESLGIVAEGPRFATPEPLGPGGDPYPAMFGKPDPALLDKLVSDTVRYWRDREEAVLRA
ncbi:MAG: TIM barrel protein [bacterium]